MVYNRKNCDKFRISFTLKLRTIAHLNSSIEFLRPCQCSIFITTMAERIKLFQFTISVYKDMGIYPKQLNQNRSSFNRRNLFMIIPLVYYLFFGLLFLIFKAKTIPEAGISFYTVTTTLGCLTYFLINMFTNMPKIRNMMGKFEKFIEKRKYALRIFCF